MASADRRLLDLDCEVPVLRVINRRGFVGKHFSIQNDAKQASATELAQVRANVLRKVRGVGYSREAAERLVEQLLADLRIKKKLRGVRFDPLSSLYALWEQEPEEFGGGPAILHLLAENGIYLTTIRFSESWVDFEFSSEQIYALEKDEATGLVTLSAFELELPTIRGWPISYIARQAIKNVASLP